MPRTSSRTRAEPEVTDLGARAQRRQQREGEILDAACEVFLDKGFERASVSEIAARVGVVEGNVFRYFATKRELLNAVLLRMYEPLIADVGAGFARTAGLRARLRFIVWRHIRVYAETPGLARLVLHEVRTAPDYPRSVLHELQLRYTGFLRQTLEQAQTDGELATGVDFEMARSMVYGGLEHLLWPMLYSRRALDVEALADRFTGAMLHGIGVARQQGPSPDVEARLARLEKIVAGPGIRPARGKR